MYIYNVQVIIFGIVLLFTILTFLRVRIRILLFLEGRIRTILTRIRNPCKYTPGSQCNSRIAREHASIRACLTYKMQFRNKRLLFSSDADLSHFDLCIINRPSTLPPKQIRKNTQSKCHIVMWKLRMSYVKLQLRLATLYYVCNIHIHIQ